MRIGLIGLLGTVALVSTMTTAGCGGGDDDDAAADTGGGTSTGGAVGMGGGTGLGGTQAGVGGGVANPVTTLSPSTALSALTDTEFTQLCDDAYSYFGTAIATDTFCKWKGLSYATSSSAPTEEQLRSNCSSTEATCLADPAAALANNPGCNSIPANCTATVADYSACIMDEAAAFTQTVNAIPACAEFTSAATSMVWDATGAAPMASCTFTTTCQGLYPPNPLF
jgi:hypothetical protein